MPPGGESVEHQAYEGERAACKRLGAERAVEHSVYHCAAEYLTGEHDKGHGHGAHVLDAYVLQKHCQCAQRTAQVGPDTHVKPSVK